VATSADLLKRHRPFLKYDSQESYFADSAATWTDNPGNRLLDKNGKELASAEHGLSPAFLGLTYPDKSKADARDRISNPSKDYREQARKLHENKRYRNRMYGHAVIDSSGDVWLQYWFWYFYNDYNLIGNFLKAGLHEGDWEMIQIRLKGETLDVAKPDLAIYAQHATADTRRWNQVDVVPGTERPLVYVARGSHAAYFEPGRHWTGHWFDYADGKRKSPEISLNIVVETDEDWRWVRWPGRWGDTKKGDNPLDSDSPQGPADHAQWDDPLVMVKKAAERAVPPPEDRPQPPAAPFVRVEWAGSVIRVLYTVQPGRDRKIPHGLAVTINSPEEAAPPTTETFTIATRTGCVDLTTPADPAKSYDVYVSCATAAGLASQSVRCDLDPVV
jgi:VPS62-like protein